MAYKQFSSEIATYQSKTETLNHKLQTVKYSKATKII